MSHLLLWSRVHGESRPVRSGTHHSSSKGPVALVLGKPLLAFPTTPCAWIMGFHAPLELKISIIRRLSFSEQFQPGLSISRPSVMICLISELEKRQSLVLWERTKKVSKFMSLRFRHDHSWDKLVIPSFNCYSSGAVRLMVLVLISPNKINTFQPSIKSSEGGGWR